MISSNTMIGNKVRNPCNSLLPWQSSIFNINININPDHFDSVTKVKYVLTKATITKVLHIFNNKISMLPWQHLNKRN